MASITLRDASRRIEDAEEIREFLGQYGIWYRRDEAVGALPAEATEAEVLAHFRASIEALMAEGGYQTADVIDVKPELEGLEAMLSRFSREHYHTEDEVRFIVEGRGLFHIHPEGGPVFSIEVEPGDLIKVPAGTPHWFDLCEERRIRAVRLFQDKSGWTPHYTESGVDARYLPVCFGPSFVPPTTELG
jgi:1,2-dihydroxy-3-keto-5-methylthiopentene dioxygenase